MGLIFFILGACMASFIACLAYRKIKGESINSPRFSHCDACGRKLLLYEKIPILGYVITKGKCRCGYRLGIENLLVEILLALVYYALYARLGINLKLFFFLFLITFLVKIALTDLWTFAVYEEDLLILLIFSLFTQLYNYKFSKFYPSIAVLQIILMGLYFYIDRRKDTYIGEGDILVIAFLLSFFKPLTSFYFIASSFWLALPAALYKKTKSISRIAMLPYISLSFIINLIFSI